MTRPPTRRFIHTALTLAGLLAALGCGASQPATPTPDASSNATVDSPILGVDVSHFSGTTDWNEIHSAGYAFAYVKATEGVDSLDPTFADRWASLAESELPRGAYHFYVTEDDPADQARFFLDTVGFEAGDLLPVVDVETLGRNTAPGLAGRLQQFLDLVEAEVGVKPMIYTSPNFWDAHLDDSFGDYRLWIADYDVDAPRLPNGWDTWTVWQFEASDTVPGIEKDADRNQLADGLSLDRLRIPANVP